MAPKKRAVTIHDVAEAAGVSVSTVSRVLNDKVDVSSETQERVRKVIEQMGYTSSLAARSMRSRRKNLIGLVVPDIGFPYAIEIMKGINQAIAESPFDLLVFTTGDIRKNGTASHEQHYISLLNNSLTDGVVIVASATSDYITDSPIVAVDPHVVKPSYPSIQGTNFQGALDATNYLIGLGHRRIGFICGRCEIGSAILRRDGYRHALEQAGIQPDDELIVQGDFTTHTGNLCTHQLLSLKHPPTAIFASNDQTAIGVFQAASERHLEIPRDLSVVGFDNITEAQYMGLTTIDQSLSRMGAIAIQILMQIIDNHPPENLIYEIPTRLVIRTSCRAL